MLALEKANSIHPTIKFTTNWSYRLINYVHLILTDEKIITDLYVKSTGPNQYLHY